MQSDAFGIVMVVLPAVAAVLASCGERAGIAGVSTRLNLVFSFPSSHQSSDALWRVRKGAINQRG